MMHTVPPMSSSQSPESVTMLLYMVKDSTDVIKLRILRWGSYPGFWWAQCNHKGPNKKEAGGSVRGREVMMQAEVGVRARGQRMQAPSRS